MSRALVACKVENECGNNSKGFFSLISMMIYIKQFLKLDIYDVFIKPSLKRFYYLQKYHHILNNDDFEKKTLISNVIEDQFCSSVSSVQGNSHSHGFPK